MGGLRVPQPLSAKAGDKFDVRWKKKWWPAKVREVRDDFALIHYDGFGAEWDEWVTAARMRARR